MQHQRRQKETNREAQLYAELYHSWKLRRALVGLNLFFTDADHDVDWLYLSFSYFTGRSIAVNIALVAAVAVCVMAVAYLLYERKKVKGQREYQPLTVAAQ